MGIVGRQKELYQSCVNTNLLETPDDLVDDYRSGTINYCSTHEGHKHTLIIYIYASTQISNGPLQTLSGLHIVHARHLTKTQFLLTCDVFKKRIGNRRHRPFKLRPSDQGYTIHHLAKHRPQE